ncbi:hypothetical protein [Natrinema sp. 1APR25-10V2]|nr:hypothetical protein [Natrinema sp. 1APR25-10V2]
MIAKAHKFSRSEDVTAVDFRHSSAFAGMPSSVSGMCLDEILGYR